MGIIPSPDVGHFEKGDSSKTGWLICTCVLYTWVHLTRQDWSFSTRFVFFNKICLFRQDLSFSTMIFNKSCLFRQDLFFYCVLKKTILVENNKICWKRQDLLKKLLKTTRFVEKDNICWKRQILSKKTILVEKNNSCWKKQFLLKNTNLVVLDERPWYLHMNSLVCVHCTLLNIFTTEWRYCYFN